MDLSVEEILRRLLLLGLPLVPLGCSPPSMQGAVRIEIDGGGAGTGGGGLGGAGGFAGTAGAGGMGGYYDNVINNCGPQQVGGRWTATHSDLSLAAWNACFDSGDCANACEELVSSFYPSGPGGTVITSCVRIDPPLTTDGGTDGAVSQAPQDAGTKTDGSSQPQMLVVEVAGTHYQVCGRRPAGLAPTRAPARGSDVGVWLAGAATLEAASVPAFRRLARELEAHGAPKDLTDAARRAAREEARHFALMRRLARAHGAEPRRPRVRSMPVRSLGALARENAREGCVRETFGALVAAHQARHAPDAALRAAMSSIAVDEAQHAALAWQVDAWARRALPRSDARAVERARRIAGEALVGALERDDLPPAVARSLGLPSPTAATAHARRVQRSLWSA